MPGKEWSEDEFSFCLAFCAVCLDAIHKRPRVYFDEECCTPVNDVNRLEEKRENFFERQRTNDESKRNINHRSGEYSMTRATETSSHLQDNDSSTTETHKKGSISERSNKIYKEVVSPRLKDMSTDKSKNLPLVRIRSCYLISLFFSVQITNDNDEGEEDQDGSMKSKRLSKQKQKNEGEKMKKDQLKKKKQTTILEDFPDEDGSLWKPKNKTKETKAKKKIHVCPMFSRSR